MNSDRKVPYNQHRRYVPPYDRLERRNLAWKPKKVRMELQLQEECKNGDLTPFQQPSQHECYFIHKTANVSTIETLIERAKTTQYYSIDTEDDPIRRQPALLQIEFIQEELPVTVVLVEVQYLPDTDTDLFIKLKELCDIIFSSNKQIFAWGSPNNELLKFRPFNFMPDHLKIRNYNVQFRYERHEKISLQNAIKYEFKEYLNKSATLGEWACGIDRSLGMHVPTDLTGVERGRRMYLEKKYRKILKEYAINDVFAVTKLSRALKLIPTTTNHTKTEEQHKDKV